MPPTRINARLSPPLAEFVASMVGTTGLYETPSEYIRDLIRHDMEQRDTHTVRESLLSGYRDWAAGAVLASTSDFQQDMQLLEQKDAHGWT